MSTTGIPLQSAQNPQPQPDEDMLAMLGLHPAQLQVAQGLASGAIHPQQVLDAATPKPPLQAAENPAPGPTIAAPAAPRPAIAAPPDAAASRPEATLSPSAIAPPPVLSGQTATPRIAPTLAPAPDPLTSRTQADQAELDRVQRTGSGLEQFQHRHPVLGTIARIGAGVGSAMFPGIAANIPGTDLHHQVLLNQDRATVNQDLGEQEKQAQVGETGARTAHEQAQAAAVANPPAKEGITDEEKTFGSLLGQNNPATGKPYTALEAFREVNQAKTDTKPDKTVKSEKVTRVVNGVPHEVLVNSETGEDIKDEGVTKLPGESAGEKRSAAEQAQVEREARGNIRKAEGQYRATQQTVSQLTASIDAAKDGNGLLTSFVPTMEVLGINASNGVHRISPAEAQAAGMPGSFVERFNAFFDKASTGKLSPELQTEGKALAGILLKSAHARYKSTYDDENGIVSGYGVKDFGKKVPAIAEPSEEGAGGFSVKAPNGKTYSFADQKSLDNFKKEAGIK